LLSPLVQLDLFDGEDDERFVVGEFAFETSVTRIGHDVFLDVFRKFDHDVLHEVSDNLFRIPNVEQVIDGRRFDIGIPEHYLETLEAFRQP